MVVVRGGELGGAAGWWCGVVSCMVLGGELHGAAGW
jgi:hypothetical protein